MISAGGVSAFDGNHNMPSGIWAEFREQIYKVYGGPSRVATGWVSNTLFEPHVADSILKSFASRETNLQVWYRCRFVKALTRGDRVTGAVFQDLVTRRKRTVRARQVIDATELGDVMADAGVPFDLGMEASAVTGENVTVPASNDIVQDLTWVAILKDYGPNTDRTMVRPDGYDPMEFDGCNNQFASTPAKITSNVDARKMLDYGRLPNGKYMINWPGKGNDIYLNVVNRSHEQREAALHKARAKTLRFVYFLQTQFGFRNLDLADDEFPTADRLALIPYHREGRRLRGIVRFKVQHISEPFRSGNHLYRTGISVGDYPIDHHHRENPSAPQHLGFYPIPSYNIPLGVLIPENTEGLIVAEKGISVSNVVNGTTRLQPVVMMTGQAAGTLAALAVKNGTDARAVSVRAVQTTLLATRAYIMPYYDVKPTHPQFLAIQKVGATGILKGKGEPFQWANRTWFHPDSSISTSLFVRELAAFTGREMPVADDAPLSIPNAIKWIGSMNQTVGNGVEVDSAIWNSWGLNNFQEDRPITRAELAVLLDRTLHPFESHDIDHFGNLKSTNKN
jgi:hypothetical protein